MNQGNIVTLRRYLYLLFSLRTLLTPSPPSSNPRAIIPISDSVPELPSPFHSHTPCRGRKRPEAKDPLDKRKKKQKAPNSLTSNLRTYHPMISTNNRVLSTFRTGRERKEQPELLHMWMEESASLPGILVQRDRCGDEEREKEKE